MKKFYLLKNFQVIYGLILIILVPVVVALNTIALNKTFQRNIDVQLQRQAMSLGKSFNVAAQNIFDDKKKLQSIIDKTLQSENDVKEIQVLEFKDEEFIVMLSSNEIDLRKSSSFTQLYLSWYQNQAIATLFNKQQLDAFLGREISYQKDNDRYWLVTMPLVDEDGSKRYLLTMSVSLSIMDELIKDTLSKSYIFLSLTVLLLILLLAANSRLFEYAVLYKRIKEIDKMKDEFISIASHELRTPLTVIKGYVSMLLADHSDPEETEKSLQTIAASSDRLADLVEDLLNVSRIEQGRLKFDIKSADPLQTINEVIKELSVETNNKRLELVYVGKSVLPRILVDNAKFKQVLINIVGNSVKYTIKGSVKIECSIKQKFLQIKIVDTGIGMSAKARERLFEKFYRIKNDDTKNVSGTGLGLWITKRLIENMSGEIFVDSIEGVGTSVSILLPLANKSNN